jgi:hypothetical protein
LRVEFVGGGYCWVVVVLPDGGGYCWVVVVLPDGGGVYRNLLANPPASVTISLDLALVSVASP